MRKWNARLSYHMSISNTFSFKVCFVHLSGRWEMKCTCKQTEMIHGSWLLFISCINYIQQWDLVKYIYNFLKTLLETNQTLLSSGVLTQAWLGWQSAELSLCTKSKLTLVKSNGLAGWRPFLSSLSIVMRWRTEKPAMKWVPIYIRLSIKHTISHQAH